MKKITAMLISVSTLFLFSCTGSLSSSVEKITGKNATPMNVLGAKASSAALEKLGLARGERMLVLTNAGYAKLDKACTAPFVDGIIAVTGCTPGASSLGIVHSAKQDKLWISVTDNSSNTVYIGINPIAAKLSVSQIESGADKDLYSVIEKRKTGYGNMIAAPDKFNKDIKNSFFGGNLFRIAGISCAWNHPAFSNDLFRAVLLHNHFCPGVGSGVLISRYTEQKLPLSAGESYTFISCPNWCKEDAFVELFDATPGKRGIYVKALSKEQKKYYDKKYHGIAGIVVKWNRKKKIGKGIVLGFNFKAGATPESKKLKGAVSKLYSTKILMDNMMSPEKYVSSIKNFKLKNRKSFSRLTQAGINPLKELGI